MKSGGRLALVALMAGLMAGTAGPSLAQGSREVLFSGAGEVSGIYAVEPESGQERQLSLPGDDDGEPVWSPSGSDVAFVHYLDRSDYPGETRSAVAVVPATGTVERRLTDGNTWDAQPVWSPDGGRIAFVRYATTGWSRIAIVDVASSEVDYLTREGSHNDEDPVWTPDGERVVFTRWKNGVASVRSIAGDGSDLRNLTGAPRSDETDPSVAPNGRIAFVRQPFGRDGDVCIVRADGSRRRCPLATRSFESEPEWSPDGRTLAFVRTPGDGDGNVMTYGIRSREIVRLTRGPAQDRSPRWDPGGDRIAFIRVAAAGTDVYVVASSGEAPEAVTVNDLEEYELDW